MALHMEFDTSPYPEETYPRMLCNFNGMYFSVIEKPGELLIMPAVELKSYIARHGQLWNVRMYSGRENFYGVEKYILKGDGIHTKSLLDFSVYKDLHTWAFHRQYRSLSPEYLASLKDSTDIFDRQHYLIFYYFGNSY